MGIIKIDKDEVNKLLNKAKEAIGEDNVEMLSDIKKTVVSASSEIKETIMENYGDKIDETKKTISEEKEEIKKKGVAQATFDFIDKRKAEKEEKERIAKEEEQKRIEAERRKLEAQKKKRKQWLKEHKILVTIIAALLIVVCASAGVVSSISNKGKISIGYSSSDLINKNYETVVADLKAKGFKNIKLVENPDLIIGLLNSDGDVESISIANSSSFSSSSKFYPNDMIVITYHTYPKKDDAEQENNEMVVDNVETEEQVSSEINSLEGHFNTSGIPIINASLDEVMSVCEKYGIKMAYDDMDCGDGTMFRDLKTDSSGMMTSIIYVKDSKEVVSIDVVPNTTDSHEDQSNLIIELARLSASDEYKDEVAKWFKDNIGLENKTTIDGIIYEIHMGTCDNYCAYFGEGNWEKWVN